MWSIVWNTCNYFLFIYVPLSYMYIHLRNIVPGPIGFLFSIFTWLNKPQSEVLGIFLDVGNYFLVLTFTLGLVSVDWLFCNHTVLCPLYNNFSSCFKSLFVVFCGENGMSLHFRFSELIHYVIMQLGYEWMVY